MKSKKGLLALLSIICILTGCDKNDFDFQNKYENSHKAWQTFKTSAGNSYTYTTTGSSWVGLAWETKITVSNGVVTSRDFKFVRTEGFEGDIPEESKEWSETAENVGSRKNTPASDPITLDDVYQTAKNDWLRKKENSETFFETENNGIISLCGYRDKNCADDCFRGIRIISIKALK